MLVAFSPTFFLNSAPNVPSAGDVAIPAPMLLRDLTIRPDAGYENFDVDRCEHLLRVLIEQGATTVESAQGLAVSLDDFFVGNRDRGSIAANAEPAAPYNTAAGWYEFLKSIRNRGDVHDVLVSITAIKPHDDGTLRQWPYSDTIWVYTSFGRRELSKLLAPLQPNEVRNFSVPTPEWNLNPPRPAPPGFAPFRIWWD